MNSQNNAAPPSVAANWRSCRKGLPVYSGIRLFRKTTVGHLERRGARQFVDSRPLVKSVDYDFNGNQTLIYVPKWEWGKLAFERAAILDLDGNHGEWTPTKVRVSISSSAFRHLPERARRLIDAGNRNTS